MITKADSMALSKPSYHDFECCLKGVTFKNMLYKTPIKQKSMDSISKHVIKYESC